MTRKQRHLRQERMLVPPSAPPRNPFATAPKMLRGSEVHEKSRGAQRRADHIATRRLLDPSTWEDA